MAFFFHLVLLNDFELVILHRYLPTNTHTLCVSMLDDRAMFPTQWHRGEGLWSLSRVTCLPRALTLIFCLLCQTRSVLGEGLLTVCRFFSVQDFVFKGIV